jgi:hypothetical protein
MFVDDVCNLLLNLQKIIYNMSTLLFPLPYISMTDLQIIQVIGLIFLLVGGSTFLNKWILKKILEDYSDSMWLMLLSGMITVFMGFVFITFHNIWVVGTSGIVTLLGWAMFIKWAVLMLLPEWSGKLSKKISKMKPLLEAMPLLMWLVGIVLLYIGFFTHL